jgi:hypothetical protein
MNALMTNTPPATDLTARHLRVLRNVWSRGRAVALAELGGVELDLIAAGLLEQVHGGGYGPSVRATDKAVAVLAAHRQKVRAGQQPHHDLAGRLAHHLQTKGFLTWSNVEFAHPNRRASAVDWGTVRPDVFACWPSLQVRSAKPAIYEVKVSRADFLADVAKPLKRKAYADLAQAVYYCCPDGMIAPAEVPDGFGLLCEVSQGQFALRRKARRQPGFALAPNTLMTLLVKTSGRPQNIAGDAI